MFRHLTVIFTSLTLTAAASTLNCGPVKNAGHAVIDCLSADRAKIGAVLANLGTKTRADGTHNWTAVEADAITAQPGAAAPVVHVAPPVGCTPRVAVQLDEIALPADREAQSYLLRAARRAPSDPDTVAMLPLPATGVAAGRSLVRTQVEGAERLLIDDPVAGMYNGPTVTVA